PGDEDVEGHPRYHLVAVMGDRGIAVDQRQGDRDDDRGGEAEEGRAAHRGRRAGGEGGAEHLALEADIDDARALAEQAAERRQDERRGEAQRRRQQRDELEEGVAHASLGAGAGRSRASRTRKRFSSAPQNRMTSPSMTTMISRCSPGISKASSLPPW